MNPFDYLNAINQSKKDMMRGTANDKLAEKDYVPFMVNRALSYHNDTVYFANEMNRRHHIDNLLQFDFLLNIVRPKSRYAKWAKKQTGGDVEVVKEYYGYNDARAYEALTILTEEQLSTIRTKVQKGGRDDTRYDRGDVS